MLEQYLEIFYVTCEQLVPIIVPVFGVYLILYWIGSLLLDRP